MYDDDITVVLLIYQTTLPIIGAEAEQIKTDDVQRFGTEL